MRKQDVSFRPDALTTYLIIMDQVMRRPEEFIARLNANIERRGECRLWKRMGTACGGHGAPGVGYPSITFRYRGRIAIIFVHRLFLTMMLRHPIPKGYHAGHDHSICSHSNCVFHLFAEEAKENSRESAFRRHGKKAKQ